MCNTNFQRLYKLYKTNKNRQAIDSHALQTGVNACRNFLTDWGLSDAEVNISIGCGSSTSKNLEQYTVDDKICFRVSLLLGICADLMDCFIRENHRRQWLSNESKSLNDRSPMSIVKSGDINGLAEVRALLASYLI